MAELKVNELATHVVQAGERVWLNADGQAVKEGDASAETLFAIEGDEIDRVDAVRVGLVKPTAAEKKAAAKNEDDE